MPILITDLSSYIWLITIALAVLCTLDTGDGFGYASMAGGFTAMLFGFTGICFYFQCAVFFITLLLVLIAEAVADKVTKGKKE